MPTAIGGEASGAPDADLDRAFDEERAVRIRTRTRFIWAVAIAVWVLSFALVDRAVFTTGQALFVRGVEVALATASLVFLARPRRAAAIELASVAAWAVIAAVSAVGFAWIPADKLPAKVASLELSCLFVCLLASFGWRANLAIAVIAVGSLAVLPGLGASDLFVLALTVVGFAFVAVVASSAARDRLARAELGARRALEQAHARLAREDELRRRLFVDLSHDLRTPLAVVRGEAALLRDERVAAGDLDAADALRRVEANATALASLAEQLLDLARLEAGQMPTRAESTDVAQVAREIAAQLAPPGRGIDVRADGVIAARVDPVHLARIVANLVANALRQTTTDGAPARVSIAVGRAGDRARLDVVDDGPGVPADRRELVFARFVSFDAAGGTTSGIGLPLARELAVLGGGSLELLPERPTTFRLELPASDEPPARREPPAAGSPEATAPRAKTTRRGARLLVVEDNDDMAELVVRTLGARWDVARAKTAAGAIDALGGEPPAAIVSDVMLPDGTGYDVLAHARARRELDGTPVLLVSALGEVAERVRGLAAGADDYLAKPFAPEELARRVETAIERAAAHRRALEAQRDALLMEVHDGVSASLARASLLLADDGPDGRLLAAEAIRDGLEEVRAIQRLLAPRGADVETLGAEIRRAVGDACGAAGIALDFEASGEGPLPPAVAHTLRRVAREATTNAIKHAGARTLAVRLAARDAEVELAIEDDGRGFPDPRPSGQGLGIMRRRVARVGGAIEQGAGAKGGVRIVAVLPRAGVSARE